MKKILLLLIVPILISTTSAQNRRGWNSLFDGRSLSGWNQISGDTGFWVEKGILVGSAIAGQSGNQINSEQTFSDFIIELEVLLDDHAGAAIVFRNQMDVHTGYRWDINNAKNLVNEGLSCLNGRGHIYPNALNPKAAKAINSGNWNQVRIECIGNSIRTWINDIPIAYVIDDLTSVGHISLQTYAGCDEQLTPQQVKWRNIRIRTVNLNSTLTPDVYVVNLVPNTLSKPEIEQGWRLLFDGKSSEGWVNVYNKTRFPEEGWIVSDGMIAAVPNRPEARVRGACIVTTEKFRAFEFQFEFMYAEGANSGIKYGLGNGGVTIGLEYQILDDKRHPDANGGILGNRRLSSLYDLIPADYLGQLTHGPNAWNYGRLVLYPNNRVEHWLNGVKVLEYVRGSSIYNVLVAHSKYDEFKGFGLVEESPILLQYHQDEVKFRSIKIREL